jgi:hypothetical protein
VRVDRDKVRARLSELGISSSGPVEAGTRPGVILLRISDGVKTRASYGATAELDPPGLGALASRLRSAGIRVVRAKPTPGGNMPLDDAAAAALVGASDAEVGVIASVTVGAPVPVRGLPITASLVTSHVRIVGRDKRRVGEGEAALAMPPASIDDAIARALVAAVGDALPKRAALDRPTAFAGDDTPLEEPGVVLIRVPSKTPWVLVKAEIKYLRGARGVRSATLHRVSPGGWVIGVTTSDSAQHVARIARKAPTSETSVKVKLAGDIVDLAISGGR